jgi:uncharacterized Zn ribbon protein
MCHSKLNQRLHDLDGKYLFSGLQDGNVVIMHHTLDTKQQTNTKINGNTVQNISLLEDANVLDDVLLLVS